MSSFKQTDDSTQRLRPQRSLPLTLRLSITLLVSLGLMTSGASRVPPALDLPGSLDLNFGDGGKVTTAVSAGQDNASAVAVQADGKIVVAGVSSYNVGLARYNPDGSLDATFDGDGKVTTTLFYSPNVWAGLAVQPDGKIVVAATDNFSNNRNFALARYNGDGSLDTSFDGDGMVTTDFFGRADEAHALAIQPDGKIVAAGNARAAGPIAHDDFALARYNPDGSLDLSFGLGGKATTDFGLSMDQAYSVAIQPGGEIVTTGYHQVPNVQGGGFYFALARHNPDGSPDLSFDTDGRVTTTSIPGVMALDLALQSDGKIVVAGWSTDFLLVRYNPDGSLDETFGTGGAVVTDFGSNNERSRSVAIQSVGGAERIVVVGDINNGYGFALARYLGDGSLDTDFDGDGKVITTFSGAGTVASAVAIQPDSKIVAAGTTYQPGTGEDFAVTRYHGDTW